MAPRKSTYDFNGKRYVHFYYGDIVDSYTKLSMTDIYKKHLKNFKSAQRKQYSTDQKGVDALMRDFKEIRSNGDGFLWVFSESSTNDTSQLVASKISKFAFEDLNNIGTLWKHVYDGMKGVNDFCKAVNQACEILFESGENSLFGCTAWKLVEGSIGKSPEQLTEEEKEAFDIFFKGKAKGSIVELQEMASKYSDFKKKKSILDKKIAQVKEKASEIAKLANEPGPIEHIVDHEKSILRDIEASIINGVLVGMKGLAGELATAVFFASADESAIRKILEIDKAVVTGSKENYFTVKTSGDRALTARLSTDTNCFKSGIPSKSDVVITVTKNNVSFDIGLSVKNYGGYAVSSKTKNPSDIKILTTDLFSLLTREIGYNDFQLIKIFNIFAGVSHRSLSRLEPKFRKPGYNVNWERANSKQKDFMDLKRELAAESLLSALTGIQSGATASSGHTNTVFSSFIVVTGRLIPMGDVLEALIEDIETRSSRVPVTIDKITKIQSDPYEKINEDAYLDIKGPIKSKEKAKKRSEDVISKVSQKMGKQEINILLRARVIQSLLSSI